MFFTTSSDDYSLILWDAKSFEPIKRFYTKSFPITKVVKIKENGKVLYSNIAGIINVLDLQKESIKEEHIDASINGIKDFIYRKSDSSLFYLDNNNIMNKYNLKNKKKQYNRTTNKK
jgi:WD40 repeat protein